MMQQMERLTFPWGRGGLPPKAGFPNRANTRFGGDEVCVGVQL